MLYPQAFVVELDVTAIAASGHLAASVCLLFIVSYCTVFLFYFYPTLYDTLLAASSSIEKCIIISSAFDLLFLLYLSAALRWLISLLHRSTIQSVKLLICLAIHPFPCLHLVLMFFAHKCVIFNVVSKNRNRFIQRMYRNINKNFTIFIRP